MFGAASGNTFDPVYQNSPDNVTYYSRVSTDLTPMNTSGSHGPEVALAHDLGARYGDDQLGIIRHAVGGVSLHQAWAAGNTADTTGDGYFYVSFQNAVSNHLADLELKFPGYDINIAGFLWTQGEKDALDNRTAVEYENDLTNFISDIRLTYGEIPFYYSRLSDNATFITNNGGNIENIQQAQDEVASKVADVHLINTDDYAMLSDNIHYTAASLERLGAAYADLIMPLPVPEPSSAVILLIGLMTSLSVRSRLI